MNNNDYYNKNAHSFIEGTLNLDMSDFYIRFEKYLNLGDRILDVGCGPGRDLKYFSTKYTVLGLEPSRELFLYSSEYTNAKVINSNLIDAEIEETFHGVWACASLLHIPSKKMNLAFCKIDSLLEKEGILYCSFKHGEFEGVRNGRTFTDLTEDSLGKFLDKTNLKLEETWITSDLREGRESEKWLNAIILKS